MRRELRGFWFDAGEIGETGEGFDGVDDLLGFGTGNEDVFVDIKIATVEILYMVDVGLGWSCFIW